MFDDIQIELEAFFDNLNWTYIFMYVITLYGIEHKDEFKWYNELLSKKPWLYFKVWIAGIVMGILFCFFHWEESGCLDGTYISQLLRSWIVVLTFNTIFTKKIQKFENEN